MGKMGMWCRVQCGAGGGFPDVADEKGKVCVRPISLLMSHIGKTTGGPAGMCPPGTCATLGTFGRGSASAPSSAAPGLPIPLRYIPASAVALRRDGTASAVVVERQRGFRRKPKQRSHRPECNEGRVPLKGAVSVS